MSSATVAGRALSLGRISVFLRGACDGRSGVLVVQSTLISARRRWFARHARGRGRSAGAVGAVSATDFGRYPLTGLRSAVRGSPSRSGQQSSRSRPEKRRRGRQVRRSGGPGACGPRWLALRAGRPTARRARGGRPALVGRGDPRRTDVCARRPRRATAWGPDPDPGGVSVGPHDDG